MYIALKLSRFSSRVSVAIKLVKVIAGKFMSLMMDRGKAKIELGK